MRLQQHRSAAPHRSEVPRHPTSNPYTLDAKGDVSWTRIAIDWRVRQLVGGIAGFYVVDGEYERYSP